MRIRAGGPETMQMEGLELPS